MTNEAAAALHSLFDQLLTDRGRAGVRRDYAHDVVDEALAAERRATVERIRLEFDSEYAPDELDPHPVGGIPSWISAILDAEAER